MLENVSISVNRNSMVLVNELRQRADELRVKANFSACGVCVIDAGIDTLGGLEAGRIIAEICMGGLGSVAYHDHGILNSHWPLTIHVKSSQPVLACLASQYAGWSIKHEENGTKFQALGSGPARALSLREEIFDHLAYKDAFQQGVIVFEVDKFPPDLLLQRIAKQCHLDCHNLTVILTPTNSLAGSFQVAARVLEVGLHKAHSLDFPLKNIVDGVGSVPFPPPGRDIIESMGRTNDVILFCGHIHLFVNGEERKAEELAQMLPSNRSKDFGKPFAQLFKEYQYDFFAIDPMLFSPARAMVTHIPSGNTFACGQYHLNLLQQSIGPSAAKRQ